MDNDMRFLFFLKLILNMGYFWSVLAMLFDFINDGHRLCRTPLKAHWGEQDNVTPGTHIKEYQSSVNTVCTLFRFHKTNLLVIYSQFDVTTEGSDRVTHVPGIAIVIM